MGDDGFLSRWARRKAQEQQGRLADAPPQSERALARPPASAEPAAPPVAGATPARAPATAAATRAQPGTLALTGTAGATGAAGTTGANSTDTPSPHSAADGVPQAPQAPQAPTLDDVARLDRDAPDYSRFVARNVQPDVRNAALKKLFTDPHFNVMDRLDIYIDDYGQPDPLPEGMLARLAQGQFLGLFTKAPEDQAAPDQPASATPSPTAPAEPEQPEQPEQPDQPNGPDGPDGPTNATQQAAPPVASDQPAPTAQATTPEIPEPLPDENADLRLQPDDAAGRPRPAPGPEPDAGRAH